MSGLTFIEPAGVTFLSNVGFWLNSRGCKPSFINVNRNSAAIKYLDDAQFFMQHCGQLLTEGAEPRETTRPLQRIDDEDTHAWLRMNLIPWLSSKLGMSEASLVEFQVCISELFNNISDHSTPNTGSIFVQFYPNKNEIRISVADFGCGIPENVRKFAGGIDDGSAILKAVTPGFSTKSTPRNRGAGLDILLMTAVTRNGGTVSIFSQTAYVVFSPNGTTVGHAVFTNAGYCPGTTIDICLRTDTIERVEDGPEEFEW